MAHQHSSRGSSEKVGQWEWALVEGRSLGEMGFIPPQFSGSGGKGKR